MSKKTVGLLVIVAAVALGLAWIFQSAATSPTPALRLGTNVWPGYEPLYLARAMGKFDEESVRLVECPSASQVIREFRNNTLEVAALTLDEVLLLKVAGYDVQVILVNDISHGGDVILGRKGIASLQDLKGKQVGVENTALGAYVLTRALQSAEMSPDDVTVVSLEVHEHERAFADGDVDAVVTFDPVRSRLIKNGAGILFDSSQMPGEIVDVLVTRRSTIEDNPEKFKTLMQGWFAAVNHLSEQPDDAASKMAPRLKLEPSDVLASYDGLKLPSREENLKLLGGATPQLEQTAKRLAEVMLEKKLIESEVEVSGLFSTKPLKLMQDD